MVCGQSHERKGAAFFKRPRTHEPLSSKPPGSPAIRARQRDCTVAWKMFSAGSRDTFLTALSIVEATRVRACGWVLSQALIALAYYTVETNPVLVREAQRWMAEVLADESTSPGAKY